MTEGKELGCFMEFQKNEKREKGIKQKIIFCVMSVSVLLGVLLITAMIVSNLITTKTLLLDNMQMVAKISSQNISSNLHLLTDRMANLALEEVLVDETAEDRKSVV